nr:hypothetical protein [Pseudomonas sp. s4]
MPHPRQEILNHPDALNCTVYRPDEQDPDAEEQDLGDGKVLITGAFEPPQDWDAHQREDYFGEEDPTHFVSAHIECLAKPATREFFMPESGDYVAVQSSLGDVVMYYVYDHEETEHGRHYVLIRDDEEL